MKKILSLVLSMVMVVTVLTCLIAPVSAGTPATTWTLTKDNFTAADSNFSIIYDKSSDLRTLDDAAATVSGNKLVDADGATVAEVKNNNVVVNSTGYPYTAVVFTAPTDGSYTFNFSAYRETDSGQWANKWVYNGTSWSASKTLETASKESGNAENFTVTLTAGQKIAVGFNRSGAAGCLNAVVLTNVSVTRAAINDTPVNQNAWTLTTANFKNADNGFKFVSSTDKATEGTAIDPTTATDVVYAAGDKVCFKSTNSTATSVVFEAPVDGEYTYNIKWARLIDETYTGGGWCHRWFYNGSTWSNGGEQMKWDKYGQNTDTATVTLTAGQKLAFSITCGANDHDNNSAVAVIYNLSVTLATNDNDDNTGGGNDGGNAGGGSADSGSTIKKGYKFDMVKGFGLAEKYDNFSFMIYNWASNKLVFNPSVGEFTEENNNVMLKPVFDSSYNVIGVEALSWNTNAAFNPSVVFTVPQDGTYTFEAEVKTSFPPTDAVTYKDTVYFYLTDGTNTLKKVCLNDTNSAKLTYEAELKKGDVIYLVYFNNSDNVQKKSVINSYVVTYEKKAAATGDNTLSAIALVVIAGVGITVLKKKKH